MIKCNNGKAIEKRIVKYGDSELSGYVRLGELQQLEMLVQAFLRMLQFTLLNNPVKKSYWSAGGKNPTNTSIANQLFSGKIVLKHADKATCWLVGNYLEELNAIDVEVHIIADDPEEKAKAEEKTRKELAYAYKKINEEFSSELFIASFFDVLSENEVAYVVGKDAVMMKRIHDAAPKNFPLFKALSERKKMEVLRQAYRIGRTEPAHFRDIYVYARATIEAFNMHRLLERVYKQEHVVGLWKIFRKTGISSTTIGTHQCPRFINYEYTAGNGTILRTSIQTFDLWELIAKRATAIAGADGFVDD